MRNIINYLGTLLAVLLISTTFAACSSDDDKSSSNAGLTIKVFFPTKVVTNQPMTINGSGFTDVTEIEFPGGTKVTNFEKVSDDMLRVNAPSGIGADGGKIIVRTASGNEAESPLPLTAGKTIVSGFSHQPGDSIQGGNQLTVYGSDLEFVSSVELLDADGKTLVLNDKDFYRKGTSSVIFIVPKNVYTGKFVGKINTFDGEVLSLPELYYKPAPTGHWETVKTPIWTNDGSHGEINWNGDYLFATESNSIGSEICTIPQNVWDQMKTGPFYLLAQGSDWVQMELTTNWWSTTWTGNDITTGSDLLVDEGDGKFSVEINLAGDPIVDVIDEQLLLFTGGGYTPLELYTYSQVWVED